MLKWTSQQIVLLVFWIAKSLQTKSLDQRFHVLTSDKPAENGNVVVFSDSLKQISWRLFLFETSA